MTDQEIRPSFQKEIMTSIDLIFKIRDTADMHNIDRQFLMALVHRESSFNSDAIRYECDYPWLYNVTELAVELKITHRTVQAIQRMSYGLCQIMGALAYEYGFRGGIKDLFDPDINLRIACLYIDRIKGRYSSPWDIYAAYNAGSVRMAGDQYVNQSNVSGFKRSMEHVEKNYSKFI